MPTRHGGSYVIDPQTGERRPASEAPRPVQRPTKRGARGDEEPVVPDPDPEEGENHNNAPD